MIWVVGTQKLVHTLDDGMRRIREYSLPREDARDALMDSNHFAEVVGVEHELQRLIRKLGFDDEGGAGDG